MATQVVRSKPQVCAEKKRLAHLFIEAVREVMTLQEREMTEVVREGIGLQRFELAIERARSKRDCAREAYQLHVQMHCC